MKICLIADNINPKAGLGRMVTSIASRLHDRGHEIGFVVSEGESKSNIIKVNFRFQKLRFYRNLIDLFRVRFFVRKYDVIICFDMKPAGIIAYLATLGRNDLLIVHSIGTYSLFDQKRCIKNNVMERIFSKANKIFVINEFVKRKIKESRSGFNFGLNTIIVPVGVDTNLFNSTESNTCIYLKDYIISVGALKHRKGQLESVKAFCSIADIYPNLYYVLVGSTSDSPDYYSKIVNYLTVQNLLNRVIFLENISDSSLIDLYSHAKFFVLTPTSTDTAIEGFGMVYIEAAVCGITSIGTLNTGAEEAIVDKKTGLLVEQNNVNQITCAMKSLLEDEYILKEYAHNASVRALTFDWDCVVDLYEVELRKIIPNK